MDPLENSGRLDSVRPRGGLATFTRKVVTNFAQNLEGGPKEPPGCPQGPPGSPRAAQRYPPGPMVGDMVAQWWGALPPKPPGMSAANQAASVGIDFQQGHRLKIEDWPMRWVSVISTNGETFE